MSLQPARPLLNPPDLIEGRDEVSSVLVGKLGRRIGGKHGELPNGFPVVETGGSHHIERA